MKVLVTGASSGIGRVLSEQLVRQGDTVWGIARRGELLKQVAEQLGSAFSYAVCDVAQEQDVQRALKVMQTQHFIPDVVVLNAGIYRADLEEQFQFNKAYEVFQVNLLGALRWVGAFIQEFSSMGQGQFIAISSIAAYRPERASSAYSASKAALSMAFRSLRLHYAQQGIQFKTVYFGPVATNILPRYGAVGKRTYVLSADEAANHVRRVIVSPKTIFYHPGLTTWPVRLSLCFPDRLFDGVINRWRR